MKIDINLLHICYNEFNKKPDLFSEYLEKKKTKLNQQQINIEKKIRVKEKCF